MAGLCVGARLEATPGGHHAAPHRRVALRPGGRDGHRGGRDVAIMTPAASSAARGAGDAGCARLAGASPVRAASSPGSPSRAPSPRPTSPCCPALVPARSTACSMVSVVSTPKIDRHAGVEADLGDALGDLAGHVVEVRRAAADDGAQADHGVVLAALGQALGDQRHLERARYPGDVDVAVGDVVARAGSPGRPRSSRPEMSSLKRPTTRPNFSPLPFSLPSKVVMSAPFVDGALRAPRVRASSFEALVLAEQVLVLEQVAHLVALGAQVAHVVVLRRDLDRTRVR